MFPLAGKATELIIGYVLSGISFHWYSESDLKRTEDNNIASSLHCIVCNSRNIVAFI